MSMLRAQIALAMFALLILLLAFQEHRERLVASCVESGGVWDGQDGRCRLIPRNIYLERDLKRI